MTLIKSSYLGWSFQGSYEKYKIESSKVFRIKCSREKETNPWNLFNAPMASFSEEGGFTKGLNYINGGVNKFEEGSLKIPHIGVNLVETSTKSKIYSGIKNSNCQFYFVHSYKLELNENCVVGKTQYISKFISSFEKDNIVGVQFHPELSQSNGLKVISNFLSKI